MLAQVLDQVFEQCIVLCQRINDCTHEKPIASTTRAMRDQRQLRPAWKATPVTFRAVFPNVAALELKSHSSLASRDLAVVAADTVHNDRQHGAGQREQAKGARREEARREEAGDIAETTALVEAEAVARQFLAHLQREPVDTSR